MTQTTIDPTPAGQPPVPQITTPAGPVQATVSETDQFLRRFVVVTATLVASVIALGIIFVTAMMPLFVEYAAPKELVNWGGIIIGFYFGTFASLLKDWLSTEKKGV